MKKIPKLTFEKPGDLSLLAPTSLHKSLIIKVFRLDKALKYNDKSFIISKTTMPPFLTIHDHISLIKMDVHNANIVKFLVHSLILSIALYLESSYDPTRDSSSVVAFSLAPHNVLGAFNTNHVASHVPILITLHHTFLSIHWPSIFVAIVR
jgi:hypothetical protein